MKLVLESIRATFCSKSNQGHREKYTKWQVCDTELYSVLRPDRIDGAEVGEIVLVRSIVPVPRHHVERRMVLRKVDRSIKSSQEKM
jgi:hypothetical protein